MPQDADHLNKEEAGVPRSKALAKESPYPWLRIPQPIQRIFDKFPILTYPPNDLPQRTAASRTRHALYIFTTHDRAKYGRPSFNPGCLKWQAYLKFLAIDFVTVSSNNHASPSGALPFLLPAASSPESTSAVPSNRIQRWTRELTDSKRRESQTLDTDTSVTSRNGGTNNMQGNPLDMRYEAYLSLLDHRIRNAYLYTLYLCPQNFAAVASPAYIQPTTTNYLARATLAHQLQAAATAELVKQSPVIDIEALYRESDKAFEALSELLGEDKYFFGEGRPGLFDASVFAYTNILLDEGLDWRNGRMKGILERCENLVGHERRILRKYFDGRTS